MDNQTQIPADTGTESAMVGTLGMTFRVMLHNAIPFGLVALLFTVIEGFVYWRVLNLPPYGIEELARRSQHQVNGDFGPEAFLAHHMLELGTWVVLNGIMSAVLIYGTVMYLRGRAASLGGYVANAIRVALPVALVSLLVTVIVMIGSIVLIIPGIIASIMFWVAVPAVVIERTGVLDSMARSAALTHGYRWRVFSFVVVIYAIDALAGHAIDKAIGDFDLSVRLGVSVVVTALIYMLYAVFTGVLYYRLRAAKEGIDIDQIAAVFD